MAVAVLDELETGMPTGKPGLWLAGAGEPTVVRV